jgi:membrane-associated protease RseP (regulator of RpoE activity)
MLCLDTQAKDLNTIENASRLEIAAQLRAQLPGILSDAETLWNPPGQSYQVRGTNRARATIVFRGHLITDPETGYTLLRERFAQLGYTPLLHSKEGYEWVTAIPIVFAQSTPQRWWINVALFCASILSTMLVGALLEQGQPDFVAAMMAILREPYRILSGLPASATIMSILTVHELGHYFAARRHGLDSSLPYFIPLPFGLIGTMGAVIRMRTPWEDRNALFDVGAAGPLAGIIVALPLFFIGMMVSPATPPQEIGTELGAPLLLRWMEDIVYMLRGLPEDYVIYVNSWAFTAWFALFVSGLNLLPIGQLDGGHVAYAVLGDKMRILSLAVLVLVGLLGIVLWPGWFTWIFFSMLSGWMHPPPLNTLAPLSHGRKVVGIIVFALMVLLFTPAPFPSL